MHTNTLIRRLLRPLEPLGWRGRVPIVAGQLQDDAYQRWRVFGCPKQTFDLMGQVPSTGRALALHCAASVIMYKLHQPSGQQVEHELVKAEKGYLKEMQAGRIEQELLQPHGFRPQSLDRSPKGDFHFSSNAVFRWQTSHC